MNQQIWSGIAITLLTTSLGTMTSSQAQQTQTTDQDSDGGSPAAQVQSVPTAPNLASELPVQPTAAVKVGEFQSQDAIATPEVTAVEPPLEPTTVVKVGEFQSQDAIIETEVVAKIHAHEINGHQAATLSVRRIPVLTFLGSPPVEVTGNKLGEGVRPPKTAARALNPDPVLNLEELNETDPVWRATAVAARLNQLSRDNVEAEAIAVHWTQACNCYSIKVHNEELVQVNDETILPDTTRNLAEDALQATNRLRRLLGDAPPLREIAGLPPAPAVAQVSLGPIRVQISGVASWYGPGFHGNRSASGERFNQNAMTAAHRSLPFGTKVQVTNLNNGLSVVVRINDRGPFAHGRVIDLSAAAAKVLGIVRTGVAPVRLDVLEPQAVTTAN